MEDAHGRHGTRRGPVPDGGRDDSFWSAGHAPPPPPTDADLPGALAEDRGYLYRIRLTVPGEAAQQNVLEELRRELEVLGTSVGRDVGPEDPATFDVLATSDYDPGTVADALVEPEVVEAVTIRRAGPDDEPSGADPAASDGDLAGSIPAVDDGGPDGAAGDVTGERAPDDGERSPDVAAAVEEARETFRQLRAETERAGYEEVLEELEGVTFDREFDAAPVDLDPLLEDAGGTFGRDAGGTGADGAGGADTDEADEPDDGGAAEPEADGATGPDVDSAGQPDVDAGADPSGEASGATPSRRADGVASNGDVARATAGRTAALAPEAVVDALVTAVEEDTLDDGDREAIAHGLGREFRDPQPARVDSLQGTLDDVATGLVQLKSRVDEFDERLADVEGAVESLPGEVPSSDELSRVDERATATAGEVADIAEAVDELEAELSSVRSSVDELARWPEQLGEALGSIEPAPGDGVDGDVARGGRSDERGGRARPEEATGPSPPGDAGVETDGGSGFEVTFPDDDGES